MRKSAPDVIDAPLPYVELLGLRATADIDLIVIHCTELPDLATAREYGEQIHYPQSGTGNSGHFYIDRDGSISRWVPENRIAHHVRGRNAHSIGIELMNTGRFPRWLDSQHQAMDEAYTPAQIEALIALLEDLQARFPSIKHIAGHEDLDTNEVEASDDPTRLVRRKRDPGPMFPWTRVLAGSALQRIQNSAET